MAKVCAMENIVSCSCDTDPLDLPPDDSDREYSMGCSDNVDFGIEFATQFLHRRHQGVGQLQTIERHNMQIGAEVCVCLYVCMWKCVCVFVCV